MNDIPKINPIWSDRLRHLGLPISFTKYSLTEDRMFLERGLFNLKEEEILLYRVRDLALSRNLWQRIFRVGTVTVTSGDKTTPVLEIKNIKHPKEVKELIHSKVEDAKRNRRMRATELLEDPAEYDGDIDS